LAHLGRVLTMRFVVASYLCRYVGRRQRNNAVTMRMPNFDTHRAYYNEHAAEREVRAE
jgi:hypothetical protein